MGSGTMKVSYTTIIFYFVVVLAGSLLAGLLPPFINRPTCASDSKIDITNNNNIAPLETRFKREAGKADEKSEAPVPFYDIAARKREFLRDYPEQAALIRQKVDVDFDANEYKICPEINKPDPSALYPWGYLTLPREVVPSNYEIFFFISEWFIKSFSGATEITADVVAETEWFVLHSKQEIPELNHIKDRNGNEIEIDCIGLYPQNDYFVFKTKRVVRPSDGPIKIKFSFISFPSKVENSIFELTFDTNKTLLASKFQPLDARHSFPCYDEPSLRATFNVTIDHPVGTRALFNTDPIRESEVLNDKYFKTQFDITPSMPIHKIAFVAFETKDFGFEEVVVENTRLRIWSQKRYEDYPLYAVEEPIRQTAIIYQAMLNLMENVNGESIPNKIDIFAIPDYPVEYVSHYGLPIIRDNRVLFNPSRTSEREVQEFALLMARVFAEHWVGNFVGIPWWDELWLQESFADYLSYQCVEMAFPEYQIYSQFITEELVQALTKDGYPSATPVKPFFTLQEPLEIEELFNSIEKSKGAAILRMVEETESKTKVTNAIVKYINSNPWGVGNADNFYDAIGVVGVSWNAKEFFERWLIQSNYPLLSIDISLRDNISGLQEINIIQSRGLNAEFDYFFGDTSDPGATLYPTEYKFEWWVPVQCSMGTGISNSDPTYEETFYVDMRNFTAYVEAPAGQYYKWIHCNRKFTGYYEVDYTAENWKLLGEALFVGNNELLPSDRAQLVHNVFANAYAGRTNYRTLVDTLLFFFETELQYLPLKTLSIQLKNMLAVLDYKQVFYPVAEYFINELRAIEDNLNPWIGEAPPNNIHIRELVKEVLIDLSCRLQDPRCLNKANTLFGAAVPDLFTEDFDQSVLPPFVRETVFNYHLQNTYGVDDYFKIFFDYESPNTTPNFQRQLLKSLSFPRVPWLLATYLDDLTDNNLRHVDFFEAMRLLGKNTLGRELAWDYLRINFEQITETYGLDDVRIGQMLIDVTQSFENSYLFFELLDFVYDTSDLTGAAESSRFTALEIVSTNLFWYMDNEIEIYEAFKLESRNNNNSSAAFHDVVVNNKAPKAKTLEEKMKLKNKVRNAIKEFKLSEERKHAKTA